MPTYSYECTQCDHEFDIRQSMSDDQLTDCPKCNKTQSLQKVIKASTGFSLKGNGWYVTDFKE